MAPTFVACDREQPFLLPPDARDWLPEDHFAWFVIDAVERIDMAAFCSAYRGDGRCRPAYEPAMMLALLLWTECRANEAYEAFRARGVMRNGRRMGPATTPKPYTPPERPQEKINTTDLDSRLVKGMDGWLQGDNAQAATNEQQIVLAAEVKVSSPDFGHLEPMFAATGRALKAAGVSEVPQVLLADAGYRHSMLAGTSAADYLFSLRL